MVNKLVGLPWASKGERQNNAKPGDSFKMPPAMMAGPAGTATTNDFVQAVVDEEDSSSEDSNDGANDGKLDDE
eukprot:9205345-Alexandrium_andersonii.AAC.1